MTTLTCMRGYPGSGKSTIARTIDGAVVCRDDLRMQMFGTYRPGPEGEDAVTVAERAAVEALLKSGVDVVVDAMHVNPRYLRAWAKMAARHGIEFVVHDMKTSVRTCVYRDSKREKCVGDTAIRKLAARFPMESWPTIEPVRKRGEIYIPKLYTPPAILVDIDGTLAHMDGRSPYDYSKVHTDVVDEKIRDLVNMMIYKSTVIVVTGRDEDCREETGNWLTKNEIYYDDLLMRPSDAKDEHGNKLPDWIVKLDLFDKYIRDQYDVQFVLDDRQQVVDMWRSIGLKCLQVEPGDF